MCALYCKVSAVRLTSSTADSRLLTVKTSISCRRWTRATRCLMRMMLYTKVDAHCDKLALVVGQTSTDASTVNHDDCHSPVYHGQCDLHSVSVDLPSASENVFVFGFVPWHHHL